MDLLRMSRKKAKAEKRQWENLGPNRRDKLRKLALDIRERRVEWPDEPEDALIDAMGEIYWYHG
jgi:hypothetical protein